MVEGGRRTQLTQPIGEEEMADGELTPRITLPRPAINGRGL